MLRALRVFTVNIHKGFTPLNRRFMLRELREAVHTVGSDVVCLQEVLGSRGGGLDGPQGEFLADRIWHDHAYARNAVGDGLEHGNAVLSRFPILRWRNHDVSMPGDEPRGLLHTEIRHDGSGQPLHLVCLHLGLREAHRRVQLARLLSMIEREVPPHAPLVVAGDFNDWRGRADAALRQGGLLEVFHQHHGRHAKSFPARWPILALDRIYVRHVRAARPLLLPRRPWHALSDHAPLAAEIHL